MSTAGQILGAYGPRCLGAAGDCAGARKLFNDTYTDDQMKSLDAKTKAEYLTWVFESFAPRCVGKK